MSILNKTQRPIAFAFCSIDGKEETPRVALSPGGIWRLDDPSATGDFQKYRTCGCVRLSIWDMDTESQRIESDAQPTWTGYIPLTSKEPIIYEGGRVVHDEIDLPGCECMAVAHDDIGDADRVYHNSIPFSFSSIFTKRTLTVGLLLFLAAIVLLIFFRYRS
jgi:hypothetical protein